MEPTLWDRRRSRLSRGLLPLIFPCLILTAVPAWATVVVPVPDEALAESAVAIVTGQVTVIESHWDPQAGQIVTHVTISLDDVLKGDLAMAEVTLKQIGGTIGDLHSWVLGSPEFVLGEKVFVFLDQNRDGTLRVAHLYQGKFSILADALTGEEYAYRETPLDVHVLPRLGATGPVLPHRSDLHVLRDFKERIRSVVERNAPSPAERAFSPIVTAPRVISDVTQTQEAFTFLGPARWFEPDSDLPVSMLMNSSGEPLAPTSGFDQIRAGYQAWSTVPGASFSYQDGGFTSAGGFQHDFVNAISFRDPLGQMSNPVGCAGTLAIGGFPFSSSETRTVNGQSFFRILEGDVVFNDGWAGCGFYENFANFAEVATHELGHVLGLGHSSNPDATMAPIAHFDGRGASLRSDDIAGLTFIYPGVVPGDPVVLSANPSRGVIGTTLNVTLTGEAFQAGASADFGAGITVNSTAFNSTTRLVANITIQAGASVGARTITVTNPGGHSGSLANGFTVERFAVVTPDGSTTWFVGGTQTIQWLTANVGGNVRIDLSRDGGTSWRTITGRTRNDGSQPWRVTGPPTPQARIRVTSTTNPAISDTSNPFTISCGSITVLSPNGGEVWLIGSTQTIQWTANGVYGQVRIEISRDGGLTWANVGRSLASDGARAWRVRGPATTQARVRVSSTCDAGTADMSDGNFTVQ